MIMMRRYVMAIKSPLPLYSVTLLLPFLFKIFVTIFPFSLTINFPLPVRFLAVFADISPEHLEKIPQCTESVIYLKKGLYLTQIEGNHRSLIFPGRLNLFPLLISR